MGSAKVRIGAAVASLVVAAGITGMTGMIGAAVSDATPCTPGQGNTSPPANTGSTANQGAYHPDTTQPTIVTVSCDHVPEVTPVKPTQPPSTVTVQTNTGTMGTPPASKPPQATPRQPAPPVTVPQPTYSPIPLTPAPVPPPPPVVTPAPPPPAPPVPNVMLTSSVDAGTQSLAIILVFLVIGSWFYANRIVSQWTLGKKAHASGSA